MIYRIKQTWNMLRSFSDIKNAIYINLDSRVDRRELFEKQFAELAALYPKEYTFVPAARFSAIRDDANGAMGCTRSHIECLKIALHNDWEHAVIFEDDALLIHPEVLSHQVTSFLSCFHDNWDVLLLSGNNYPPFKIESPNCFRVANCQTTGAYLVCRRYYKTLIQNFEDGLAALQNAPHNKREFACDQYWKRLQRVDRWYLITPICVIQRPGYSDIEKQDVDYERLMTDLVKKRPVAPAALPRRR